MKFIGKLAGTTLFFISTCLPQVAFSAETTCSIKDVLASCSDKDGTCTDTAAGGAVDVENVQHECEAFGGSFSIKPCSPDNSFASCRFDYGKTGAVVRHYYGGSGISVDQARAACEFPVPEVEKTFCKQ